MKNNFSRNLILFLISVVFSVALIFAFIELPRLLDNLLQNNVGFPGFDHGASEVETYKTELYIKALHLRLICYISLAIVLTFIVLGFVTRKSGWAWVVLTYTLIFMGLSLIWVDFGRARSWQEQMAIENPQKMIDSLLAEIKQTESRRKVSGHFTSFRPLGDAAVDPMIKMLSDDWEVNREYVAMILGYIPSQRAVPHLILALDDPDQRVR